jgi:DNA polymerase-3 subunit gamma/tau
LERNISAALLTFNEILNNGFDGHNFINGLSSHFRDLLVCKDEITLKLLEVSPNVKEKYKIQSRQCSVPFLLELLDIAAKCDMNYRAAKHQRLHVEISLMKMCALNGEGLKKKLETLAFTPQKAEQQVKPFSPPPSISSIAKEPATDNSKLQTPNSKPSTGRSGISITETLKPQEKKTEVTKAEQDVTVKGTKEFSQRELEIVWDEFAVQLQKQGRYSLHAALVKRKPSLKENFKIEFLLDNSAVEKDVTDVKMELMVFLRQNLDNGNLQLTTLIDKSAHASKTPYTPKEKFERLLEKNPALKDLKNTFDLDIEY